MKKIPKNHPRYESLMTRALLSQAVTQGIVHKTGLIAHGRGEAFDYLLGEQTIPEADEADQVAAAALLTANHPMISINGNVAALSANACIRLAMAVPAGLEINLFHRTPTRMRTIAKLLEEKGATRVYGLKTDARIPGLNHDRARCEKDGIYSADAVLIPLEDGDRCQALRRMGKLVIAIDLNPLSRTAQMATITVVDNLTRAIPRITYWVQELKKKKKQELEQMVRTWDNTKNLQAVFTFLSKRLNSLS